MSVKWVAASAEDLPPPNRHPVLPSRAATRMSHQRALVVCGNPPRGARAAEVGEPWACRQPGSAEEQRPGEDGFAQAGGGGSPRRRTTGRTPHGNREGCIKWPLTGRGERAPSTPFPSFTFLSLPLPGVADSPSTGKIRDFFRQAEGVSAQVHQPHSCRLFAP